MTSRASGPSRPSGSAGTPSRAEVLDWSKAPFATWFADGTLNAAYNCLDRHVEAGLGDRVAFHFEGEPGDTRTITYAELTSQVKRAANALSELGVQTGDRVAIYLPMIPEAVVAMLACARLGAPHTVVFGGFSADALSTRILDCGVEVVITADGGFRRGAMLRPETGGGQGTRALPRRTPRPGDQAHRSGHRDDRGPGPLVGRGAGQASDEHECEFFPAEHPLYIMYTSGSTGKPKGILHTTGGYLVGTAYTHWASFDLKSRPTSSGPPPTSAGSPATRTWCTGRWRTPPRPSCTRARPTPRTRVAGGRSSRSTG